MTQQTQQSATSLSDQLSKIGKDMSIQRDNDETDLKYAHRLLDQADSDVNWFYDRLCSIREIIATLSGMTIAFDDARRLLTKIPGLDAATHDLIIRSFFDLIPKKSIHPTRNFPATKKRQRP